MERYTNNGRVKILGLFSKKPSPQEKMQAYQAETQARDNLIAGKLAETDFQITMAHDLIYPTHNTLLQIKMCVDNSSKRIAFVYVMRNYHIDYIDFDKILSCEITQDGQSSKSTSLGVATGGVPSGLTGGVAGGFSMAKTSTESFIESLRIILTLKGIENSRYTIDVVIGKVSTVEPYGAYVLARGFTEKVKSIADNIINDRQASLDTTNSESQASTVSSADELLKFKSLLDSGVITQEEFDAKKKQILGL